MLPIAVASITRNGAWRMGGVFATRAERLEE